MNGRRRRAAAKLLAHDLLQQAIDDGRCPGLEPELARIQVDILRSIRSEHLFDLAQSDLRAWHLAGMGEQDDPDSTPGGSAPL